MFLRKNRSPVDHSPIAKTSALAVSNNTASRIPAWSNTSTLQRNLIVNQSGKKYQPETDALTEQAMRNPESAPNRIHYSSSLADQSASHGMAAGEDIYLNRDIYDLDSDEQSRILAHEQAHVAQQRYGKQHGDVTDLELEANKLAPSLQAGQSVRPRFRPSSPVFLNDTTPEQAAVENAKKRLKILEAYVDEWTVREGRRLLTQSDRGSDRDPLLKKRKEMDEGLPEPRGQREGIERKNLSNLNQLPLKISITDDTVTFAVNFHVRFEDPKMSARFSELSSSLKDGIKLVWLQRLRGSVFSGRLFTIDPIIELVPSNSKRDLNYWLISVRPKDDSPVAYRGCTLDQPDMAVPTSVTDPNCDGGLMSIPPRHISLPGVLGHEILHLSGLVDRYIAFISVIGSKKVVDTTPSRETNGRKDPLGGEDGTILAEDLAFLFDQLGVYALEENRGLKVLQDLEKQGLNISAVRGEMARLEDLIARGGKRESLIRPRENFNDKILKSVEDL